MNEHRQDDHCPAMVGEPAKPGDNAGEPALIEPEEVGPVSKRPQDDNSRAVTAESAMSDPWMPASSSKEYLSGREEEPLAADFKDGIFALAAYILGFFFARWVLFSWQGWGVTVFTLGYCAAVGIYLRKKGVNISRAGWFWLAVVMLTGISFSLWTGNGLEPWRSLLLFCGAIYWILSATGLTMLGKTSSLIVLDGFNAMVAIPFRNIGFQYKSLVVLGRHERAKGSQVYPVLLGLILTIMVLAMVLPLLMQADSGGFYKITHGIFAYFHGLRQEVWKIVFHGILAVPIGAYLFGLVAGSANQRGCDLFSKEGTLKAVSAWRILPPATVYTLLGLLCVLYMVFIVSQLPYFFSAFTGKRPEGWLVYSEYARSGFFELCRIAAINLMVLIAANVMGKKRCREDATLKVLNVLLAILTMVLIATALSKMIMYIGAYGLSMRRLLPCVFMLFMAAVCGGVIALQKWQFSITRFAVGIGVAMLCTLCLADPDAFVVRYNADRYLAGTLTDFDVNILYRSGPAGADAALEVYAQTGDKVLQAELKKYLAVQYQEASLSAGHAKDNLQTAWARQKIKDESL
ncbi:MAG TPA: DUF4173 domain-containing protein [Syntrophomonas sp.]|nr:DUF4173 domain-containing protein [Syntrophomonas sp.]